MDSHQNNTEDGESERKITKEESQMFKHQTEVREKSNR